MHYREEIDGIRAIAVLAVMIAHSGVGFLPGGFAGVDVFFVISGYLISGIVLRDLEVGKFSFRKFYARRARRIFPALFFMLLTVSIAAWVLLTPSELKDYSASAFFSLIFVSNFYFIDFTSYFAPSAHFIPLLHTWSLAIEEQFYVIFPLLAFASYRLGGKKALWMAVICLLVASFALSEWGWRNKPEENYFFSPSRFWEILLGAVVAFWSLRRAVAHNDILAGIGLAFIFASFVLYDESTPFPSAYALLPTLGTAFLLLFTSETGRVGQLLSFRPLRMVGLISFSAYLWHQPVFAFARIYKIDPSSPWTATALIASVLSLSLLSWKFVEQPFRSNTKGGAQLFQWSSATLVCAALLVSAMAYAGHYSKLPLLRYNDHDLRIVEMTRDAANDFQRHVGRPFERRAFLKDGSLPKVMFIGDSYARDFMNVLNAKGYLSRIDPSYWTIAGECAPYFQEPDDARMKAIWDTPNCRSFDRYRSPEMMRTITEADVVILVSNWRPDAAPFLVETVNKLRALSSASIVLVGPKQFGKIDVRALLQMTAAERVNYRNITDAETLLLNSQLQRIEQATFLDIIAALCDHAGNCPQVTEGGRLISQDGAHLTPDGALLLGDRLEQDMDLSTLLKLGEN